MNQNDLNQDQRRHARFELLDYAIVHDVETGATARSVVIDVSLGGLQVRSRFQFEAGKTYELQIGRIDSDPLVMIGEVRYSVPIEEADLFATGFRCASASDQARVDWVNYVHAVFQAQGEHLVG